MYYVSCFKYLTAKLYKNILHLTSDQHWGRFWAFWAPPTRAEYPL